MNCLVTKLKETVADSNLAPFGYSLMDMYISNGQSVTLISSTKDAIRAITSDTKVTVSENDFTVENIGSANRVTVYVKNTIERVSPNSSSQDQSVDISNLYDFLDLVDLSSTGYTNKFRGSISSVANLTKLKRILTQGNLITGDLSSLSELLDLEDLNMSQTSIRGDIAKLGKLIKLGSTNAALNDTNIRGAFESFVESLLKNGASGLKYFSVQRTKVTFNSIAIPEQLEVTFENGTISVAKHSDKSVIGTYSNGLWSYS